MTSPDSTVSTPRRLPAWATGFGAQVIAGLIIGLLIGILARPTDHNSVIKTIISFVGATYVSLLKVMVPPLVVTAVITSVANLRKVTNAAKLALSTLIWFAITAFFSVVAAIGIGLIVNPGANTSIDSSLAKAPNSVGSWSAFINSVIPNNFLGLTTSMNSSGNPTVSFNVLQLLVISLAFGIAALRVGSKAEPFLATMESLLNVIQKVLWWIIRLAPIGTAALIARAVAEYGWTALGNLGSFVIAIYLGLAVVIGIIYPIILWVNKLSVRDFYRRVWPVTSLGFVSRSSMGVMPLTVRVAERRLGVPSGYASFAVPLGATTKMDGCAAVYPAIAAIFIASFYGIDLHLTHYLLIAVVSVIGSAATAGTTGATVMLTLTLSTLGLPLEGVGLLLSIEPIVDMGRTAVNVTGQALVPTIVAKRASILDMEIWEDGANADLDLASAQSSR